MKLPYMSHGTLLLCLVVAPAASSNSEAADTLWDHNGSVMRLHADGNSRLFTYEVPRPSLQEIGVETGTILFEGSRNGSEYFGVARRFSGKCGTYEYEVSGIVENELTLKLSGEREIYDENCHRIDDRVKDELIFTYLGKSRDKDQRLSVMDNTLWEHNGSTMIVRTEGPSIYISYIKPRDGLLGVGVRPGTLLFSGTYDGKEYIGEARRFSSECGELAYSVRGFLDRERIILSGKRYKYDKLCNRTSEHVVDNLIFGFLGAASEVNIEGDERVDQPSITEVQESTFTNGGIIVAISTRIHEGGEIKFVSVSGDFREGDQNVLKRALLAVDGPLVVSFESDGGSLSAGIEIGTAIWVNEYATLVEEGTCASACALAWLAGRPRYAGKDAHIGFHAPWQGSEDNPMVSSVGSAFVGSYLNDIGITKRAVAFMTAPQPNEDLNWLNADTARALGIQVEDWR